MASDKDDLEHELRHNLKLRRKLGAQAGKAEAAISGKQGGGIAYRLGWVLYWICLALGGAWLVFAVTMDGGLDATFAMVARAPLAVLLMHGLPPLVLYGLGRAFRYVLSGE